jgi:hypothetical protein
MITKHNNVTYIKVKCSKELQDYQGYCYFVRSIGDRTTEPGNRSEIKHERQRHGEFRWSMWRVLKTRLLL